ncbi:MAG: DUF411 domain-containing protein [Sphingomicrobium sp.]
MLPRRLLTIAASLALLGFAQAAAAATMVVTKNAACVCCREWVALMEQAGFKVFVRDMDFIAPLTDQLGVPAKLRSCHVAQIGDYVIEGHVPAEDIQRLLKQKPKAIGLAVPGMVPGSPGMNHGGQPQRYNVILFDRQGRTKLFAAH